MRVARSFVAPVILFTSMSLTAENQRKIRVLISAGEASGEMYGAALLDSLRAEAAREAASIEGFGVGGERMREAGFETVVDANRVAVVGLIEVVRHLPQIYREFHRLLREVDRRKPDVAVLIDFPDWNLRLAKELHRRGIPVVYYVSPQLWAWRKGRIAQVKAYVKKMLVIFPFEQEFYAKNGVEAQFVGHPLAEVERPQGSREEYAAKYGLDPHKHWIALLPGSRRGEVHRHMQTLLRVANRLTMKDAAHGDRQKTFIERCPYEFLLPLASSLKVEDLGVPVLDGKIVDHKFPLRIAVVDDAREALGQSRGAVVASGTATVETAIMGTPFVMVYRLAGLTYAVGKRLVDIPHYGMVNLIAGRRVVPELIQQEFTAERVIAELEPLLGETARREQMLRDLHEVRDKLRGSSSGKASDNAARAVLEVMAGPK
jgi:lipid-A-disaccharide synthase